MACYKCKWLDGWKDCLTHLPEILTKGPRLSIGLAPVGTPSAKHLHPFPARKFGSKLIALHDSIRGEGLETCRSTNGALPVLFQSAGVSPANCSLLLP